MENWITQVGIGGIFVILVLREVLTWLGKRGGGEDSQFPTWLRLQLQQAVTQLSKDMQSQTEMMKRIADELSDINQTLFGISGEYERIKGTLDDVKRTLEKNAERRDRKGNGH